MDAKTANLPPIVSARARIVALRGWRRAVLAIAAGGLSALAFAPMFVTPILFLTLPVFVWLIDGSADWRRATSAGWLFGFGYFFFNLFWVGEAFLVEADKFAWLLPFAVTLLPAGLAIFWALAAAAARVFWSEGIARLFVFAIALAIAEWLRGHILTGFPWNLPGYALTYPLSLMQSAALFGAYGLTAIALFVFPAPLVILGDSRDRLTRGRIAYALALAAVPLALLSAYGAWRLETPQTFVPGVKLRIVQPSVPQREKWMAEYQRRIFDDHVALSLQNPAGEKDLARRHYASRLAGSGNALLPARGARCTRYSREYPAARNDADYGSVAPRADSHGWCADDARDADTQQHPGPQRTCRSDHDLR